MSYIRETFYCINDSTKNIHLRWQNKYHVYAYTVIFILKSASNLNGNLNCSKELEHYAS